MEQSIDVIIEGFPIKEQEKLKEIVAAINDLALRTPVIGIFHPRFYVPGWIGFIQLQFTEGKMETEAKKPFYKGMNYYEFADWILTMAKNLAELHKETKSTYGETDLKKYKEQSDQIIKLIKALIEVWIQCYPEIATIVNRELKDGRQFSLAGLVYLGSKEILDPIGYMNIGNGSSKTSFGEDMKDTFYQILGIICNGIVLFTIGGLLSLIFG